MRASSLQKKGEERKGFSWNSGKKIPRKIKEENLNKFHTNLIPNQRASLSIFQQFQIKILFARFIEFELEVFF